MAKKIHKDTLTARMFRDPSGQETMFEKSLQEELEREKAKPVECLGIKFENDFARREYFLRLLEEKLADPAFRQIEGFPNGTDEEILSLSDPPFYTACPNPFIADFVKCYGQPYDPARQYGREPFAADVSEGKYHPIYRLHPYHTKVPHRAIMRYILHYTQPGDIVYDCFCGTGMTAIAAQMCDDRSEVSELGYKISDNGDILNAEGVAFSRIGARCAILNDLSPAATFIASFGTFLDPAAFKAGTSHILKDINESCSWMYSTLIGATEKEVRQAAAELAKCKTESDVVELLHDSGNLKKRIGSTNAAFGIAKANFVVWSDVFVCSDCGADVVFWDCAVDYSAGKVRDEFNCPKCNALLTKRSLSRRMTTIFDKYLNLPLQQAVQVPVFINGRRGSQKVERQLNAFDLALAEVIKSVVVDLDPPILKLLPNGFNTSQPIRSHGFTHVHHFYTDRNLAVLCRAMKKCVTPNQKALVTKVAFRISKRYGLTYQSGSWGAGGGPTTGTLYVPSLVKELNMISMLEAAADIAAENEKPHPRATAIITTQSSSNMQVPSASCDYLFLDPPFGANIMYSELNSFWEAWLKVSTASDFDAVESPKQGKTLEKYRKLLTRCFEEAYRILKPGRWMTVEFSNTQASVWNAIQTTLQEAGFVVGNVSALDKQKGSFKAITTPTAVKQDLVISAYKPNGGFEERFLKEVGTDEGVWDFVRTHLKYLPVVKRAADASQLVTIAERDPRILFDRMVAYYVRSGNSVPLNSGEFQVGLSQRFVFRDGMFFLPEQAAEYDKRRMLAESFAEQVLFVSDESSAIQWLRQYLKEKPQQFSEINPHFMQQLGGWSKHETQLDLRILLGQNFLCFDGKKDVPEQIHAYLSSNWKELRNLPKTNPALRDRAKDRWYVPDPNKAGDLEKLRERALLSEFDEYAESNQRVLKVFRAEAIRVGFKAAYDRQDYRTIVEVSRKLPESVLQEDEKLLMYFDVASTRLGDANKSNIF